MTQMAFLVVTVVMLASPIAAQQSGPKFEVASVKRNYVPDLLQRARTASTPGRFTATNQTLRDLIRYAYSVTDSEILSGPDWFDSLKFDIQATASGARLEETRPMVQRLLADRFGLVIRKEIRTRPIYRLVRARDEDKLPKGLIPDSCPETTDPAHPPACGTVFGGPGTLLASSITMDRLARQLYTFSYTEVDRHVVDATGIHGTFRFQMQFVATRQYEGLRSNNDPNLPSFTTALQEQVGLKLQPATGPVEVLVIQSARRPEAD